MRLAVFACAGLLWSAVPMVPRATMRSLERSFDERIQRFNLADPVDLMGSTRGIYIDRFGVVISSEVNLVVTSITPFRPKLTEGEIDRLRLKKVERLSNMRQMMRDMMVHTAATLKTIPADEQVVVGVSFFNQPWENTAGLPGQIVMQAPRRVLADYEAGRLKAGALDTAITETVY